MCVNPDHLFLGTHTDNVRDMVAKGRHGYTKLTSRDWWEIKQLRGHMTARAVAKAYGVTNGYVSHIQLGRYQR